ncbi:MAG: hypothetical protein RL595_3451, partial [Planctomycetota bacterium]
EEETLALGFHVLYFSFFSSAARGGDFVVEGLSKFITPMETSSFGALGNFGCLGFVVFLAAVLLFAVAEGKIELP